MLGFKSKNWQKIKRSKQILSVLAKYGLDFFTSKSKVFFWKTGQKKYQNLTIEERVRLILQELGPTFIKFGQILSTRPDFVPQSFLRELEKLQDRVSPFDYSLVQKAIEEELGKPIADLFKEFEMNPVAAASLSQVHKAVLQDGEIVAVKIQRPHIKETIEADLEILKGLAGLLENHLSDGWIYRPRLMVSEFEKAIKKELNFISEAHNLDKFRMNFDNIDYVKLPKVYWDLTTEKILTMEFVDGVKINEVTQEKYKGIFDPKLIADRGADIILKQILEDRFFHADPHPANLFVLPPATIVILDAGMVGRLDENTTFNGAKLLQSVVDRDADKAVSSLDGLGVMIKEADRESLRYDMENLFDRYLDVPLKNLKINEITQNIIEVMTRNDLVLPANLVLMIKSISIAETTGSQLDPDFDMVSAIKPFIKKLWKKRFSPKELLEKSEHTIQKSVELLQQLPQDLIDIFGKIRDDKLTFNFEHRGLKKITQEINGSSNRLSFSLIVASLIIGSSLILQRPVGLSVFGYPIIGIVGYLFASIMGIGLIISILRSGKLK